ncbi:MAG TPA: hypothetical protein VKV15_10770 [Bryobacteraceae bacterium]|nr:hypothetical protein [Bryobacteraceae bacterium]
MAEKFTFSSSKCDFRVKSGDFSIGGTVEAIQSQFTSTLPRVSIAAGSDKCDWRVFSRAEQVETSAQLAGEALRVRGARAAGSDKCDWRFDFEREEFAARLNMSLPAARVHFGSDKCDFRIDAAQSNFHGSVAAVPGEWRVQGRIPGFRGSVASDKCDWRIFANDLDVAGNPAGAREMSLRMPSARMRMNADKCDWRIRATSETYDAAVQGQERTMDAQIRGRRLRAVVASAKCDWSVRAQSEFPESIRQPEVSADLTTGQGKSFNLDLNLGLRGGPSIRLRAAGSDKCDFRIESIMESVDGVEWRRARLVRDDKSDKP